MTGYYEKKLLNDSNVKEKNNSGHGLFPDLNRVLADRGCPGERRKVEQGARIDRFEVKGKKCMTVFGIDWGTHLVILEETDTHILCRKPGSMCWIGIGDYAYHSPSFIIFEKEGGGVKEALGSEDFDYIRENKRKGMAKAFAVFEEKEQCQKGKIDLGRKTNPTDPWR